MSSPAIVPKARPSFRSVSQSRGKGNPYFSAKARFSYGPSKLTPKTKMPRVS